MPIEALSKAVTALPLSFSTLSLYFIFGEIRIRSANPFGSRQRLYSFSS
jgi:hypothetical protein